MEDEDKKRRGPNFTTPGGVQVDNSDWTNKEAQGFARRPAPGRAEPFQQAGPMTRAVRGRGGNTRSRAEQAMYTKPVTSSIPGLTKGQNAQLARDSIIRTNRENQKVGSRVVNTDMDNESNMAETALRGANRLQAVQQRGRNQMAIGAQKNKYGVARDIQQNEWTSQAANVLNERNVARDQQQNVYDTEAAYTRAGVESQAAVKKAQLEQSKIDQTKYQFKTITDYDEKTGRKIGEHLERVDTAAGIIGTPEPTVAPEINEDDVNMAETYLGKDFNPANMNQEQSDYIDYLRETGKENLADALMSGSLQ